MLSTLKVSFSILLLQGFEVMHSTHTPMSLTSFATAKGHGCIMSIHMKRGILQKKVNLFAAQKQVLRERLTTEGSIIFHKGEQKIPNSLCADIQCGPSFTTFE